jgi:ABC-2 type transport system permease protein
VGKLAELAGRGVVVGAIFAVLGFGLALLTRHTIAAAGTVLGYLFLWFVVTLLSQVIPALQAVKGWLPQNHMLAFLNHGYSYTTVVREVTAQGLNERQVQHTISFADSSLYWAVLLVVVIAGTYLVFRRRDVS